MLTELVGDLRHAVVALSRRPAGLLVPLLTMAIGIGASAAIFSALYAALFNPLPYPEPDRLVMGRANEAAGLQTGRGGPHSTSTARETRQAQ